MSNSSSYMNSIYEAMDVFSKKAAANSGAPLTIEAKIEEIVDAGKGIYSVSYLTNKFEVFANASLNYKVGDEVCVLVPSGDFSNDKFIIGSTKHLEFSPLDLEDDKYYDISDNLIDNTFLIKTTHSLISYKNTVSEPESIYTESSKDFGKLMQGYIDNYNYFKLEISVKTDLDDRQRAYGNYGVMLAVPVLTEEQYEYFTIDITNMKGSPYEFLAWSPQSLIFSINNQYDYSRKPLISFFCNGFNQDDTQTKPDIFFSGLSLKCINKLNEEDLNGYFLTLKASEGEYFVGTYRSTKKITPYLRLNGKETSIPSSAPIYWFKEDMSIKITSEGYSRYGGMGWKCLNEELSSVIDDNGVKTFSYNTSERELIVKKEDVASATRFKCVIVYDENNISNIITLKNLECDKYITLACDSISNTYLAGGTGNVKLIVNAYANTITDKESFINQVSYNFLRYDMNGNPIADSDNFFVCEKKNSMIKLDINNDGIIEDVYQSIYSFPITAIDSLNKIYCIGKYNKDDKTVDIGTASVFLSTTDKLKYNIIINNANKIYKYDADGDSPMIEAYDGPAASKVSSIEPLTFEIYDEEGNEFGESQYGNCNYSWIVPKKCMVTVTEHPLSREDEDYYYYEGVGHLSALNYDIARRYNKAYAMNGIKLIITYGKEVMQKDVPLFFLKDGESGTNGTSYAAILTSGINETASYPYGVRNNGNITQKITLVYSTYSKEWWYRTTDGILCELDNNLPSIYTKVYHNGEILDSANYTVEYEVFDSKITNPCISISEKDSHNGIKVSPITTEIYDLSINTCNIIKAKIVTKNLSAMNNDEQILYAYYPIEIVIIDSVIPIDDMKDKPFPSIDGGFYDVLYASDGTNPSYDETELFYLENVNTDYYTISWVAQHHLSQTTPVDEDNMPIPNAVKITPDNKYSDGNTMNYVRADMVINGNATIEDRMKERNALNEEKTALEANLNELTTQQNKIEIFGANWYSQIALLNNIKDYINTRGLLVNKANEIISLINNNKDILTNSSLIAKMTTVSTTLTNNIHKNTFSELTEEEYEELNGVDSVFLLDYNTLVIDYNMLFENYDELVGSEDEEIFNSVLGQNSVLTGAELKLLAYNAFYNTDKEFYNTLIKDFDNYYENSLYDTFIKYFDNIYNKDLKTIFTDDIDEEENNILVLNNVTLANYNDKKENIENDISLKSKEIDDINIAIGLNHIEMAYIRPIVITTNRYEMANFNAWDGNKIYVDDNQSYIMTPQIGAGVKNSDNSFTGIVMGSKVTNNQARYGMFGYYYGEQTLALSAENGSAIFGKARSNSGQIIIDPTSDSALLYSSKFFKSTAINNNTGLPLESAYNEVQNIIKTKDTVNQTYVAKEGMLIDLSTPGIVFGSGNFKVTPEGYLIAKAGGSIGGWNIGIDNLYSQNFKVDSAGIELSATGYIAFGANSGEIYSGKHNNLFSTKDGFYLSGSGLSIGSKFKVSKDGVVEIGKGASTSTGRHWTISATDDDTFIKYGDRGGTTGIGSVYISTSEICLGNRFRVTSDGVLYLGDGAVKENSSRHWTISAKRRPGADSSEPLNAYIGYNRNCFGENENGYINKESVYIGTDGIALGRTFSVDSNGNLKAENAYISGHITGNTGLIGGWTIGKIPKNYPGGDTGSVGIYRERTNGDKLMGSMAFLYDALYGFNSEKGDKYRCWQLNANGNTFFTTIYMYNTGGIIPEVHLANAKIDGDGTDFSLKNINSSMNGSINASGLTISNATLSNCNLGLSTTTISVGGQKYTVYCP